MSNIVGIVKTRLEECSKDKIQELLELIQYKPKKKKIFIKPNIVTNIPGESGVITHPKVVKSLCDYLLELGIEEIIIGEGSAFFFKPHHFELLINDTGYRELEKIPGITIINLEDKSIKRDEFKWKYGKLKLPRFIKTHEYINIPTMKTHYQTLVTLSCKNQKGLLKIKDKKNFHRKDLHNYILELNRIIKPDLNIMDAIYCLEGNGPALNPMTKTIEMDLLLASKDAIALDNVCCEIMGFDINEVKSIPKVDYKILGVAIEDIKKSFKKPEKITYFDNIGEYMTESTCTSCYIANSQMNRKIQFTPELRKKLEKLKGKYERIYVIFGSNQNINDLNLKGNIKVFCFGNCSKKFAEQYNFPWLKGCPPEYHEMIDFLLKEINS
ncbi:MAG: DUF362 domain-containing protein [Promethearchaeia archaeon]